MGNEVHVLVASADVWPGSVETFLNVVLHAELVGSPPGSGDEVPGIISSVDDGASKSVDTLDHVEGEGLGGGSQENVQTRGENVDGTTNESLESSIGESLTSSNGLALEFS